MIGDAGFQRWNALLDARSPMVTRRRADPETGCVRQACGAMLSFWRYSFRLRRKPLKAPPRRKPHPRRNG